MHIDEDKNKKKKNVFPTVESWSLKDLQKPKEQLKQSKSQLL